LCELRGDFTLSGMPLHFGRADRSPAGQDRAAELALVPGLGDHAARAGWQGPLADPGFDRGTTGFVHDMMRNMWGGSGSRYNVELPGASPPRYGNSYRGQASGHDFVVTNVFVTMVNNFPGAGFGINRAGSVCSMDLGCLLPSLTVNLRNRQGYQHAMTQQVKLGDRDFDHRFEVRSGHPDFAARLLAPMVSVLMSRDDWVFYLEFARLISLSTVPLENVADVAGRVAAMLSLVSAIPADVRAQYEVARPADVAPDPGLDTPENRARIQAVMQQLPADQRRQLMGRLRTEGPNAVFRELLNGGADQ
jgi:hypothetical protein